MLSAGDVLEVLDLLEGAGVVVWLDGGWGVDALLGRQTRPHDDLDLALAREDLPRAQAVLAAVGFVHDPHQTPGLPARFVARDARGRQLDLHPLVFDERGDGLQELGDGSWGRYPAEGLAGTGTVEGRTVCCLTAGLQLRFHLGYDPDEQDRQDMALLAERFSLALPPPYGDPVS